MANTKFTAGHAVLAGAAIVCVTLFILPLWLMHQSQALAERFDHDVARREPAMWAALQADPELHQMILNQALAEYERAGWPVAKHIFYQIMSRQVLAFASDDTILACNAAQRDFYRALRPTPALCVEALDLGSNDLPANAAAAEHARKNSACDAMVADGARRRLTYTRLARATANEYRAAWDEAKHAPVPLSQAERDSYADPAPADMAAECRAKTTVMDNLAARPRDQLARLIRYRYAARDDRWDAPVTATPLFRGAPPADFHCAPPGTRFILRNPQDDNAAPMVWTSLGQDGWDCKYTGAAKGDQKLWATGGARKNPIRLLWPLAVGKTATCDCGDIVVSLFRVSSHETMDLPWGKVEVYGIDTIHRDWAGRELYAVTRYWAPSIGFIVGQTASSLHGGLPGDIAADWRMISIKPPG